MAPASCGWFATALESLEGDFRGRDLAIIVDSQFAIRIYSGVSIRLGGDMGAKLAAAFVAIIVTILAFSVEASTGLRIVLVLFAIGVDI